MKRSALDSARGILDAKAGNSLLGPKRVDQPQLSWEEPNRNVFLGSERAPANSDVVVEALE